MKRISRFFLPVLLGGMASAASLREGEWFFDVDPGAGSGVSFDAGEATAVTVPAEAVDALPPGVHLLGVRLRDDEGDWGHVVWSSFVREDAPARAAVDGGEWFFDAEPGVGNGRGFPVEGDSFGIEVGAADVEGMAPGMHLLGVRLRDSHGRWGHTVWRSFVKDEREEDALALATFEYRIVRGGEVIAEATVPAVNGVVAHGKEGLETGISYGLQVVPVDEAGGRGHSVFAAFHYERYVKAWGLTHFTEAERENPEISGDGADPDGDGLSNAAERLFALDPRDPSDAAKASPGIGWGVAAEARGASARAAEIDPLVLGFRVPGGGVVGEDGVYRTSDLAFTLHEGALPEAENPMPAEWLAGWSLRPLEDGAGWLEFDVRAPAAARRFFRLEGDYPSME